jgi:hypothetical protein
LVLITNQYAIAESVKTLYQECRKSMDKSHIENDEGIMKRVTYWQDYHFEQDSLLDTVDGNDAL